jgi:hypothetical protein
MTTYSPAEPALTTNTERQGTTLSRPNSRVARQIVNTFVTGETSALEDLVTVDAVDHTSPPQRTGGRAGLIEGIGFYRATFSDLDVTVEQEVEGHRRESRGVGKRWQPVSRRGGCYRRSRSGLYAASPFRRWLRQLYGC